jgi:hypothetical protein
MRPRLLVAAVNRWGKEWATSPKRALAPASRPLRTLHCWRRAEFYREPPSRKVSGLIYLDAGFPLAFYDRVHGDPQLDMLDTRNRIEQLSPTTAIHSGRSKPSHPPRPIPHRRLPCCRPQQALSSPSSAASTNIPRSRPPPSPSSLYLTTQTQTPSSPRTPRTTPPRSQPTSREPPTCPTPSQQASPQLKWFVCTTPITPSSIPTKPRPFAP